MCAKAKNILIHPWRFNSSFYIWKLNCFRSKLGKAFALPGPAFFKLAVYTVEYAELLDRPERSDKIIGVSVSGHPADHGVGMEILKL